MNRIHKIIAGTIGTAALVAVTAVMAVGPPAGAGGYYGMGGYGMMHGGVQGAGPLAMSAQYLGQMKSRLAITPQQEPAWQAFAAKAAEQGSLMQATHDQHWQAADANAGGPAGMASHLGLMTQHLAGMQAMTTALTDLYAVLTPEQRGVADQYFGQMGPRGMGFGMHG